MNPKALQTAWMAKWRKALDDHEYRMSNPEAYRTLCHWETRDMLAAGVIDEMDKLEMDELVNAAYWHAVEELVAPIYGYQPGGHYKVIPRDGSPCIGRVANGSYYSEGEPSLSGLDGRVFEDKQGMRLVFRLGGEYWPMTGLELISATGEMYDLVQTAQFINGVLYPNIDDADAYRALVDTAQVALETHDFDTYRRARLLLLAAEFIKCTECHDRFDLKDDCQACAGNGFRPKRAPQPRNEG